VADCCRIPGLKLRASEEEELLGMDETEIGEFAYDYVELTRDVVHGVEEQELSVLGGKLSPEYERKSDE
jgi:hypothetical protein